MGGASGLKVLSVVGSLGVALLVSGEVAAQTIHVLDAQTGRPVEAAVVISYAPEAAVHTDVKGAADITAMRGADSIVIQHVVYRTAVFSYAELVERPVVRLAIRSYPLKEFVLSVDRWEQEEARVPDRITVIEPRDIPLQNPGTAADLLEGTGEIFVQKSQLAGGSPMLRGFAANRVLIVVDGVRMNNAIYRSGNLQNVISVDPNAVERAEVVHGPGAMTYGSDAIGGIMDFHLMRPRTSDDSSLLVNGGALARYGTAAKERTGHFHLGVGGRKLAFLGSASFTRFGDLRMGRFGNDQYLRPWYVDNVNGVDSMVVNPDPEVQVGSAFDNMAFIGKVLYEPMKKVTIGLNGHLSTTSRIDRYDQLLEERNGVARFAEWYYGPQDWRMLSLTIDHIATRGPWSNAHVSVAYQAYMESRTDRRFRDTALRRRNEEVRGVWVNLDLVKIVGSRTRIMYGGEYVTNRVASQGEVKNTVTGELESINPRYPDGSLWGTASVYAGGMYDARENLTFSVGIRGNRSWIQAEFDTTLFPYPVTSTALSNGAVTGNVGLSWRPTSWRFTTDVSTGFRAPNIDDIGKVFSNEPGTVIVPNPDLGPEYAYNFDLGVEKRFGETLRARVNGFHVIVDDIMVRRPFSVNGQDSIIVDGELSRTDALQNASQARVWGVLLAVDAELTATLSLAIRYSWQRGVEDDEVSSDEIPLRHAPPPFGSASLTWEKDRLRIRSTLKASAGFTTDELAPTEKDKTSIYALNANGDPFLPSFYSWDIKAALRLTNTFQLTGGVENITDQRYRTYSSGITAPGRNFLIAINANF